MENAVSARYPLIGALVLAGLWPSPALSHDGPAPDNRTPGGALVQIVREVLTLDRPTEVREDQRHAA